jgi:hypothetical protein
VTLHELVFGIPNWHIVNAAFTHARPEGSRFNGLDRGAWYCAYTLGTAQAEVAFHLGHSLREVNWRESETAPTASIWPTSALSSMTFGTPAVSIQRAISRPNSWPGSYCIKGRRE